METEKRKENSTKRDVIDLEYKRIIKRFVETVETENPNEFVGRFYDENFIGEMWRTSVLDKRKIAEIILDAVIREHKQYLFKKENELWKNNL